MATYKAEFDTFKVVGASRNYSREDGSEILYKFKGVETVTFEAKDDKEAYVKAYECMYKKGYENDTAHIKKIYRCEEVKF